MMGIYPPGSVVQLSDERYALVVSVNSAASNQTKSDYSRPRDSARDALVINLDMKPKLASVVVETYTATESSLRLFVAQKASVLLF